ncbi:hypothetical protein SRHO_G00091400 [Serrasalmus rhombeus]
MPKQSSTLQVHSLEGVGMVRPLCVQPVRLQQRHLLGASALLVHVKSKSCETARAMLKVGSELHGWRARARCYAPTSIDCCSSCSDDILNSCGFAGSREQVKPKPHPLLIIRCNQTTPPNPQSPDTKSCFVRAMRALAAENLYERYNSHALLFLMQ